MRKSFIKSSCSTRPIAAACALALCVFTLTPAQVHAQGVGYWHTKGNHIIDSHGVTVRLAGINWYGFETTDFVAHGLWAQNYKTVLDTIKARGYNVIRLPFSNEMVEKNPVPTNFAASSNAELINQTALQDMDSIIAYAGSIGLRVILDNHRSEAGNTNEANGLWYTAAYPESSWVADWKAMATRYSASRFTFNGNPTVIGMDLRNEPHLMANGGRTGSCWTGDTTVGGCPTSLTGQNWPVAATKAANAILAINPHLLIFVEGNDCYNGDCAWEGENLLGVAQHPVVLNVPNRVVYSAHDYGPDLYRQPWFNGNTSQASLNGVWNKYWGYISDQGIAPVWLGEFGTGNKASDANDTAAGSQGQWFSDLVTYLKGKPSIQWTYWALNGEDSYGLLDNSYHSTPASSMKQSLLATIQSPLSNAPPPQSPDFSLASSPLSVSVKQGQSISDTISVAGLNGFKGSVKLSVSGLPSGVSASFAPNPTTTSIVLTLTAGGAASTGASSVNITGSSGALTSSVAIALNVVASGTGTGGGGGSGAKCAVSYSILPYNNSAFGGRITITNTGSTTLHNWTLGWSFANGQTVFNLWNGTQSQSGAAVTVHSLDFNGTLPPGTSYDGVGFNGNWNGAINAVPKVITLNGTACSIN